MLTLLLLTLSTASAGKLADGFKGIPYGDASVLAKPPFAGCVRSKEDSVEWFCKTKIGDANVGVSYMVMSGMYAGVIIKATTYLDGHALYGVLNQAYGTCEAKNEYDTSTMADCGWRDGDVVGSWEYNQFSQESVFIALSVSSAAEARRREAVEAAKGVGDL